MKTIYGRGLNLAAQINSSRKNISSFTQITELEGYPIKELGCGYLQSYFYLDDGQVLKAGYYMDTVSNVRVINFYRKMPSLITTLQVSFLIILQNYPIFGNLLSFKGGDQQLNLLNREQLEKGIFFDKAIFSHSGMHFLNDGSMYVLG